MTRFLLSLALCALAAPALAHDSALHGLKTRTILGLEGPSGGRHIANDVLGNVPLAAEGIESLAGRNLRTRYWTIEPDGIVPIHDHTDRPATLVVLSGSLAGFSSDTGAKLTHGPDSISLEEGALAHWWHNEGDETVNLIAFDVYAPGGAPTEVSPVPATDAFGLPPESAAARELLGTVDLEGHFDDGTGAGLVLSTWKATLAPGGVLQGFTEPGEPVETFVWTGAVIQHAAAGDTDLGPHEGSAVTGGQRVWWENIGDVPAILYFGAVEAAADLADVPRTAPGAHVSDAR